MRRAQRARVVSAQAGSDAAYRCYFCAPRVIIDADAAWLSLFPVSRNFADILRR
jgi:hypothetical protein